MRVLVQSIIINEQWPSFQIHLHGRKLESLHKFIPKEALPKEYGGTQPPFDNSHWRSSILADREYFERLERFQSVDEDSFSPVKSSTGANLEFIDAEDTEDSEGSDGDGGGQFYNCDSPQSDQISYLDNSNPKAFVSPPSNRSAFEGGGFAKDID